VAATPGGLFKTPADAQEYARWGLNCIYIPLTQGMTRDAVSEAVRNAHAAGFDVMCWNRLSLDAFVQVCGGVPIDAYWFNEPGFGDRAEGGNYHQGGYMGYSETSKTAFREYLAGKYRPEELRQRFGIEALGTLELPRDGLEEKVRGDQPLNPKLWYEFVLWHNEHVLKGMRSAAEAVKKATPGIQAVPCLSPCYLDAGPRYPGLDYIRIARDPAFDRIEVDPYVHIRMNQEYWVSYVVSLMRTACRGKPLHSWTNTWIGYHTEPIDMLQGLMAAFAQGVQGASYWAYCHAPQAQWAPDYKERWKQIRRGLTFIQRHRELSDLEVRNPVAVYLSPQCFYIKYFRAPWAKHGGVWGTGYFAERTYYSLVRAHVPADVLIPPLGYEAMVRDDLGRYQVIVLPEASFLSDVEAEMLREWVRKGGRLVATGPLGTHDPYGLPRETPALVDVTGVRYGEAKTRKGVRIARATPVLPGFKVDAVIPCEGWPVKPFLAIDSAKVTYEGAGTPEENMRSFRYRIDWLKEWKADAPSLEPAASCEVIGLWDDKSPALAVNKFGAGEVVSCAAVDITVAYELVGREEPLRRQFLADVCRSKADRFDTICPPEVEVNLLYGERRQAVTFVNQGYAPVDAFAFSMKVDRAPTRVRFASLDEETDIQFTCKDGKLSLTVPEFLDFALCQIELGKRPPR
jgi:hypothetical protein